MKALNKQALRKLAKALSGKEWVAFVHKASGTYAVGSLGHERGEDIIKWPGLDGQENAESKAEFIAAANPATVLALLDELEAAEHTAAVDHEAACSLVEENEEVKRKLEAAEKRIAEHNFENRLLANADRDIKALRQRIDELSASHSKLRDTMAGIHNTIRMDGGYTPLAAILNAAKRAHEESATAAGIGVKGK